MKKISFRDALDLVDAAIKERGEDYVYPKQNTGPNSCLYVHDRKVINPETGYVEDLDEDSWTPGCVVGVVVNAAGVPLKEMVPHEGEGAHNLFRMLLGKELLDVDDAAASFLSSMQTYQDESKTWGESRARALAMVVNDLVRSRDGYKERSETLQGRINKAVGELRQY